MICMMSLGIASGKVMGKADTCKTIGNKVGNDNSTWISGSVNFFDGSGNNNPIIFVDDETKYQEMEGFGAALTNSSAWLINSRNNITKYKLISALFNKTTGAGISYVRLPIGASDFVHGAHYTYYDDNLTDFSIKQDEKDTIPVLKLAIREANNSGRELKVMASPWTAPAWMKSSSTLNGADKDGKDVHLNIKYYSNYSRYILKFIEEYSNKSIPIDAVTVQNEPLYSTPDYPGMHMNWIEQANLIENYLGPDFNKSKITTKILIFDHNWCYGDYPIQLMNLLAKNGTMDYIAGSAWHGYESNSCGACVQSIVHRLYPRKDIYFTEYSPSGESNSMNFGDHLVWICQNIFIPATRNWAKTVLLWNIALDENHKPYNRTDPNDKPECRGLVTFSQKGDNYAFEPEYYVLGHFSKFVDRGSDRIESTTSDKLETVAFKNNKTDKSIVLIVLNLNNSTMSFNVAWKGKTFSYELEPKSIVTFEWDGAKPSVNDLQPQRENLNLGEAAKVNYSVSDSGGSGLDHVQLFRKNETSDWNEISSKPIGIYSGGDGPIHGQFLDKPPAPGNYSYSVHVVDNLGNWNDESNKDTYKQPLKPTEVEVK